METPFDELNKKLEALLRKQEQFQKEIEELRAAMGKFQEKEGGKAAPPIVSPPAATVPAKEEPIQKPVKSMPEVSRKRKTDLEKFIGENLINKIGIVILVIGVGIGTKYAIDHDLISPLTRIILGYLAGLVLLGFAFRLKARYENFSAVLLSGAMAILYFITYAAHDFYALIPVLPAFLLMVLFTAFTVFAATHYDRQIIAHMGLVGAYGVPFLLGKDPGQAVVLFTYVAMINAGVLAVAVQRYWKPLYFSAFVLTWLIFGSWFAGGYRTEEYFGLGMAFNALFFVIFYLTFLAYKLLKKADFAVTDILALLANAFIFFGFGYAMLVDHPDGKHLLGLFAVGNALIHFAVTVIVYRSKLADRNLFYLVAGLVLVFITIAVPIQLNGSWVTLLWAGEALLLFWLGRSRQAALYEWLSYPLMALAFGSLLQDWAVFYNNFPYRGMEEGIIRPFTHILFLTGILVAGAFGWMTFFNSRTKDIARLPGRQVLGFFLPAILLVVLFFTFWLEIGYYWDVRFEASEIAAQDSDIDFGYPHRDYDIHKFKNIWLVNYAVFFLALLSLANLRWWKNELLAVLNFVFNFFALGAFLAVGLYELSGLRESYLSQDMAEYYNRGYFHLLLRYISYAFAAFLIYACDRYLRKMGALANLRIIFDFVFHISVLWIASSELVHWLGMAGATGTNKLALSILWGVYSFLLIGLGIWKKRRYLRIGAIVLFGITLAKLFFYDLAGLDTISKTIIFVVLGSLLLVISFLYNKYRNAIFGENED